MSGDSVSGDRDGASLSRCPQCGESVLRSDHYCEACGISLAGRASPADPEAPCAGCGAPASEIDLDRYCTQCGRRQPAARDHQRLLTPHAAARSDRGLVHERNEDAFGVVEHAGGIAAVVCDGVSTTQRPDDASAAAASATLEVLRDALAAGRPARDALLAALDAAADAVRALEPDGAHAAGAPSCTWCAALARAGEPAAVLSIGDTRAYWVSGGVEELVTADDSWAADEAARGTPAAVIGEDRRAHAITRWLGRDAPAFDPVVVTVDVATGGRMVLCTDGLWNALTPRQLLAHAAASLDEAAAALTDAALAAGGHDNITVVLLDLPLESESP